MKTAAGILALALIASPAGAALITADTLGNDNATTNDYYGVQFVSGEGSVRSVTFDVSGTAGAMFDFDGVGNFAAGTNPVVRVPSLVGLSPSDFSYVWNSAAGHPSVLTIDFAPGSFTAGDSFRFGADTDFLVTDPAPGRVFGMAGVPFTVRMESGSEASAAFTQVGSTMSGAAVSVAPEPATVCFLLMGLLARRASTRW